MRAVLDRTKFLNAYLALPPPPPLPQSYLSQSPPSSSQNQPANVPQPPPPRSVNTSPLPLPRLILNRLTKEGKYDEGACQWVRLSREHKSWSEEKDVHTGALMEILERITVLTREYYPDIKSIRGKWIDTSKTLLEMWSENTDLNVRPDIVFAHGETSATEVCWPQTFSVLQLKTQDESEEHATHLNTYVGHIFAEQVDRLFVHAITLKGWKLQVYRFDCSGVVCIREKINIHEAPEDFIQVIASFSYLSPGNLGWDPTCKIWDSGEAKPRPSYELSLNTFRDCGVYDIPWVLQVDDESFVAIKAVEARRRLSIWGRASFVVHAVTLVDWQNRNAEAKVYILKQCWQRLPDLRTEPKTAELQNTDGGATDQPNREELIEQFQDIDNKPFEEMVMERAGWMNGLRKSWMVKLDEKPITTFDTIRKSLATYAQPYIHGKSRAERQATPSSSPEKPTGTGMSTRARKSTGTDVSTRTGTPATSSPVSTMQSGPDHRTLVTRTLVRLVFDRPGWPIDRFTSKRELLVAVKMIVEELGLLYEAGVIHRDVSPSNLIISDSPNLGGHIIDFDHSKIAFEKGGVADKEADQCIEKSQDVDSIALNLLGHERPARNYVFHLISLWNINGAATPVDFHWPSKIDPIYLFGNCTRKDGFFTGTYQYLSHYLRMASFHHSCHDLDSLFWSLNRLALTLDGPGGKERQDMPRDIIKRLYDDGPSGKRDMSDNFDRNHKEFTGMMSQYSKYFQELKDFMEKFYGFVQIACSYRGYEYHHPHRILAEIIEDAINQLKPEAEEGYQNEAKEEEERRKKDKEDMAEAISKQTTVAALLKGRSSETVPVATTARPTIPSSAAHNTPPKAPIPLPIQIPTARSPKTGRVVKKSRAGSLAFED